MAGGGVKWRAGGVNGRRAGPLRESLRSLHATPHRLFLGGGQRLRQPPSCTRIRLQGDPCNPVAPPCPVRPHGQARSRVPPDPPHCRARFPAQPDFNAQPEYIRVRVEAKPILRCRLRRSPASTAMAAIPPPRYPTRARPLTCRDLVASPLDPRGRATPPAGVVY